MANHTHNMVFDTETDDQAVFRCSKCERRVGFWKPETQRKPQATQEAKGKWTLDDDAQEAVGKTFGQICDK